MFIYAVPQDTGRKVAPAAASAVKVKSGVSFPPPRIKNGPMSNPQRSKANLHNVVTVFTCFLHCRRGMRLQAALLLSLRHACCSKARLQLYKQDVRGPTMHFMLYNSNSAHIRDGCSFPCCLRGKLVAFQQIEQHGRLAKVWSDKQVHSQQRLSLTLQCQATARQHVVYVMHHGN